MKKSKSKKPKTQAEWEAFSELLYELVKEGVKCWEKEQERTKHHVIVTE